MTLYIEEYYITPQKIRELMLNWIIQLKILSQDQEKYSVNSKGYK